jgi:hypothetical protein
VSRRNLFEVGSRTLTSKLIKHGSVDAIYARDDEDINVKAVIGSKLLRVSDGMGGFKILWTDLDFLIPVADLVFPYLGPVIPMREDMIYLIMPYETQPFQVYPFGDTEPEWRYCDPFQNMYRIHTKYVGSA